MRGKRSGKAMTPISEARDAKQLVPEALPRWRLRSLTRAVWSIVAIVALNLGVETPAQAQDDEWKFGLTLYGWLPTFEANMTLKALPPNGAVLTAEASPANYLDNLTGAFMGALEARRGDWSILADFVYFDLSGEKAGVTSLSGPGGFLTLPVNVSTQAGMQGTVISLYGGHAVKLDPSWSVELIGGLRYLRLETSLAWQLSGPLGLFPQSGKASVSEDLLDAVVGARGRLALGEHWFVPYLVDIGAGSSELTWQGLAGLGYAFRWGDVHLVYRHLAYRFDDGQINLDVQFSGPALGVAFRF